MKKISATREGRVLINQPLLNAEIGLGLEPGARYKENWPSPELP